ncbi:hypothetical protein L1987_18538 [Smallanthus sonchifolius]|uniref:Uncharacterized protein n=1 Tax=Smallanthus sonchifolius TaxID=185202 RepID=A0ACB9J022_9ASTR|nr:hypothetical protein L1987_18538 [Smallanthus sonchifolius]
MYPEARLAEIKQQEQEENVGDQGGEEDMNVEGANVENVEAENVENVNERQKRLISSHKGKGEAQEPEIPTKKPKHSQAVIDEDIINMLSKDMVVNQNKLIEAQKNVINGQQMAIERMFGMKTELQTKMNVSPKISWDNLFYYSSFHKDVGGEGSSGVNDDHQVLSWVKDKTALGVIDKDEEGEKEVKDDEDEDIGGGDKDEEPEKKDDKDKGGEGGSGVRLDGLDSSDTDDDDDDVNPDVVVQESQGRKPVYEIADGKTIETDDVLKDTDNPKTSLDTTRWFKTSKSGWKYEELKDLYAVKRRSRLADVINRVKIPLIFPIMLTLFDKWHYENQTGEVIIKTLDGYCIRVFDPMDMFMFDKSYLNTLFSHPIHRGARNAARDEAMLFARVVDRALKMRAGILSLKERIGED